MLPEREHPGHLAMRVRRAEDAPEELLLPPHVPRRGDGEVLRAAALFAEERVSGAPVVPVTFFGCREPGAGAHALPPRGGRVDIVYGAPYRTPAPDGHPWPRTRKLVELTSLDLRVHMLVALDAARTLTGLSLPGPLPPGQLAPDPPTSVTPNAGGTR